MDFTKQERFSASVYWNQDFICVRTFSGLGLMFADPDGETILLPVDVSNEKLGQAALQALSKSRKIDIDEIGAISEQVDELYPIWVADLMDKYNYKTKRALFKNMMNCSLDIRDGVLTISPSYHEKLEGWSGTGLKGADNVILPINSLPEEVGAGLRLAYSRCR